MEEREDVKAKIRWKKPEKKHENEMQKVIQSQKIYKVK